MVALKRLLSIVWLVLLAATPAVAAGIQPQASQVAESCHVWPNARTFFGASGLIGAAGYIMVIDANAAPASGAAVTPVAWTQTSAAGQWFIWYGQPGANFNNGVVVCASSTGPLTYTAYSTNTVISAMVQ